MSKTAATVLAFVCLALFSIPMSAQILPRGNVYGGISYGQFTEVVNKQSYRGWEGSGEAIPFARFPHIGFVIDGSGYYRSGVTQYNFLGGVRFSSTFGKWRPFVHVMGGIAHINSSGIIYSPAAIDVGGGADYKLFFKNFSWRLQGDVMRTHYASANQYNYKGSTGIVWRF
ncbi:MAG TPA: hypothetical protein VFE61_29645 [Candidatus Sulfotelmatobacter sp.]|nr:hypothetical protein [Candidatus Sulfotelmatobacter sp.]